MARPAEPGTGTDLATLLERHAEEIAAACADALLDLLSGSHYQTRPGDEQVALARRRCAVRAATLRTGSDAEADGHVADAVRARLGQGFDVAELTRAAIRLPRGEADGGCLRRVAVRSRPLGGTNPVRGR